MSSSLLPEVPANPAGIFSVLPRGLVQYIVGFLGLYESIGLGETSKWFHELVWPIFKARFHYEPWGYDPTYDGPVLKQIRQNLGDYLITGTSSEVRESVVDLAKRAYRAINQRIYDTVEKEPGPGVGLEILAKLSKATAPPSADKTLYGANCLAVLTLADKQVWALNFQVPWIGDLPQRLRAVTLRPVLEPVDYVVYKRHAEIRLVMKIAHRHKQGRIDVDKVCCVFCASQLIALGYRQVVVGWNRGTLNWYTFAPLVMYFQDHRRAMWGEAIDIEFMALDLPRKLAFLRALVAQTKAVQPALNRRIVPSVESDAKRRKSAAADPSPSDNLPGPCPVCSSYECWVNYNDGQGWQLQCPEVASEFS
jgi:hypothetical protein